MQKSYLDDLVGVFGHPVAENPGVVIQQAAFAQLGLASWQYLTIDVAPGALRDAVAGLRAMGMRGVNLTIPHKIEVMPLLDELTESARLIGAVNTVVNQNGCLLGDNTDGKGFMLSLAESEVCIKDKRVLVLGAGGASRAVCVEMALAGASHITVANRPGSEEQVNSLVQTLAGLGSAAEHLPWTGTLAIPPGTDVLVNTTPVGLYPDIHACPDIDYNALTPDMFVQDVIHNPAVTPFLRNAYARGAKWATGAGMMINQAALNIEMWTGHTPDKTVMMKALMDALV